MYEAGWKNVVDRIGAWTHDGDREALLRRQLPRAYKGFQGANKAARSGASVSTFRLRFSLTTAVIIADSIQPRTTPQYLTRRGPRVPSTRIPYRKSVCEITDTHTRLDGSHHHSQWAIRNRRHSSHLSFALSQPRYSFNRSRYALQSNKKLVA